MACAKLELIWHYLKFVNCGDPCTNYKVPTRSKSAIVLMPHAWQWIWVRNASSAIANKRITFQPLLGTKLCHSYLEWFSLASSHRRDKQKGDWPIFCSGRFGQLRLGFFTFKGSFFIFIWAKWMKEKYEVENWVNFCLIHWLKIDYLWNLRFEYKLKV